MSARPPHRQRAPAATDEQLALAYRQLYRLHWPATLDEALKHPVYGSAIRGLAANLSRASACAPAPRVAPFTTAITPKWARKASGFDARRAAANDLDHEHDPLQPGDQ